MYVVQKFTDKCGGNIIFLCKLKVLNFTPGLTTTPTEVTTRMFHEEGIPSLNYLKKILNRKYHFTISHGGIWI